MEQNTQHGTKRRKKRNRRKSWKKYTQKKRNGENTCIKQTNNIENVST